MNNLLKFFNKRCPLIQSISLRTYHNLVDESLYDNNEISEIRFYTKVNILFFSAKDFKLPIAFWITK